MRVILSRGLWSCPRRRELRSSPPAYVGRQARLPIPELEHQQRPDAPPMVARAGGVLVEQPPHPLLAAPAAGRRRRVEQHLAGVAAQLATEPPRHRQLEAPRGGVQHLVRPPTPP